MISIGLVVSLTLVATVPVFAQDGNPLDSGAWRKVVAFHDDTNVVQPSWFPFPMTKNVVVAVFRRAATPAQRADAVASVHGTVIDTTSLFWFIRVASHPNACGVLRATERLTLLPSVSVATPYYFIPFTGGFVTSRAVKPSVPTAVPSKPVKPSVPTPVPKPELPCPSADSVLR